MKRQLLILITFVLLLVSCEMVETEVDPISEEQAALFGTWQGNDSIEKTAWVFDRYEVKWKGFSHFYKVSGDSLIISGMVYRILNQSEKEMKLMTLNGRPFTLIRKE
jgi:hypothetical protein